MIGPAWAGLTILTFFRNFSMPIGERGTPKSGQLVKCSWVTNLGGLQPSAACCKITPTCQSVVALLIPQECKIFWTTKWHVKGICVLVYEYSIQSIWTMMLDAVVFLREMVTHMLHTELPDCVVHQHCDIFHCHPHTAIDPAALLRPVLIAFFLHFTHTNHRFWFY